MTVGTTDDFFSVRVCFATLDQLAGCLVMHLLIHVNLDDPVPATGYNGMIVAAITDKGHLTVGLCVLLEVHDGNARLKIVDLEFTLMAANNQFSMFLIQHHLCDLSREHILHDSDGLAITCIPYLDVDIASDKYLEALLREEGTAHRLVVGEVWHERPSVLEHCEIARTNDETSVLGHCANALDLCGVLDIECLHAALGEYVPKLDATLRVGRNETVQIRKAVDADERMFVPF